MIGEVAYDVLKPNIVIAQKSRLLPMHQGIIMEGISVFLVRIFQTLLFL